MNAPIPRATLDDLYRTPGQAELIGGRIVQSMATGIQPSRVGRNILISLHFHSRLIQRGEAFGDNLGYAVPELPSGRESFSPDVSYYDGPMPSNLMRFVEGPPTFAVEIRSENDYGDAAEAEIDAKRADYFLVGTPVVWDVDPIAETILCYRSTDPTHPAVFARGEVAEAEPAVPGWRMNVDDVFA